MNPAHSTRHEEMLPAYALGALDGEDLRELEAHLEAGCPECRRQLDLWSRDLEELAEAVPAVEPSETTRARILRMAGGGSRPRRLPRWVYPAVAALLLLSVASLASLWRLRGEVRSLAAERERLEQQVAALDREARLAREEAQRAEQALQILAAPGVRTVVLAGLNPAPRSNGRTYVNPQTGDALFYAFELPALPEDKTYQLWFIADGKPVSAGTFSVSESGTGSLRVGRITDTAAIQAWAVTVEPQGGVPQPTGEMVLKG
jgi:anti-sigma-K factor RskA/outer membrane murein-binding lipoprotein Lpp